MPTKRIMTLAVTGAVLVSVGMAAMLYMLTGQKASNDEGERSRASVSLVDTKLLERLPQVTRSRADTTRLADTISPPTNKWFSGMALQKNPEPVYPYPNSFRPTDDGFELGLPTVSASAESITGPHRADLRIFFKNAEAYKITSYDELSVDMTYYSTDDTKLATVTIAAGVPYAFVTAHDTVSVEYGSSGSPRDDALELKRNDKTYGMRTDGNVVQGVATLETGNVATFFSVPNESDFSTLSRHALNIVSSTSVRYDVGDSSVGTELRYDTKNDKPTILARLPHQQTDRPDSGVNYDSILGTLTSTAAQSIKYEIPKVDLKETLPLDTLNQQQKEELRAQLARDVQNLPEARQDTYFGGKQLQRTAQLLLIADQLDMKQQREVLVSALRERLSTWLKPDGAFDYDTGVGAVVGKQTTFGADTEVNDHHFHYGYTIYASAVLARFDQSFLREYEPAVNLLVADIANYKTDENLPLRRNFDPYFGHSWASGTSPFKDGNNQESTSEAINAWTGVGLWASRTKNDALAQQASWMLANETATAKAYWLEKPAVVGYDSPVASIVWGGKREYKTFFSDEPNPKLSILLLPLNTSMREYGASIQESTFDGTDVSKQYGDYLLMARSNATMEQARALPDIAIDDGNSRTYLYAYIMTNRD